MTTSPQDAQVAVRSFARRFDELARRAARLRPPEDAAAAQQAVTAARAEAARHLVEATTALGGSAPAGADLPEAAAALDTATSGIPAEGWDEPAAGGRSALEVFDAAVQAAAAALRQAERRLPADD